MKLLLKDSLLIKIGLVIASVVILAFANVLASLFITDTMKGLATAINDSGALRMRSYRIASNLYHVSPKEQNDVLNISELITSFELHLYSINLIHALPEDRNNAINHAYQQVTRQWLIEVKPLFSSYLNKLTDPSNTQQLKSLATMELHKQYLAVVVNFVDHIDQLVVLLEKDAETKIQKLRWLQYITLILTLIVVTAALFIIYQHIHKPLNQLLMGAQQVRNNDFSFRLSYLKNNELGRLGIAFNAMSKELSKIYNELELRVTLKTQELEQKNNSLALLYKTVNQLSLGSTKSDSSNKIYLSILNDIENYCGMLGGAICLGNNQEDPASMLANTLKNKNFLEQTCLKHQCKNCFSYSKDKQSRGSSNMAYIPITDSYQQYGTLIVEGKQGKTIAQWQYQLFENIAQHIGISIKLSTQSDEIYRGVLREERNTIARELHDSLAQSLTFMKIQVSRLKNLSHKREVKISEDEEKIISELQFGLNSAYKELRELLTTFRLKIEDEQFNLTLKRTVEEFDQRSECLIEYDNQINYSNLTPNEEIHILQLIREALSNVVQHAHASHALVTLKYTPQGQIQIKVTDNGSHSSPYKAEKHHYGLTIMHERAKHLGGKLYILNQAGQGCEIKLDFMPINQTSPQQLTKLNKLNKE